ncbi:hypothetical protein [Myxococcus stipitatus]|uniref:hypothetical protein n=1 Tax=Myxococcus stipitatus TaxID=83455 RepID=UPI0030CED14C
MKVQGPERRVRTAVLVLSGLVGGSISGVGYEAATDAMEPRRELIRRVEILEAEQRRQGEMFASRVSSIEANVAWLVRAAGGVPLQPTSVQPPAATAARQQP